MIYHVGRKVSEVLIMENTTVYSVVKQHFCTQELGEYDSYGIRAECGEEVQVINDVTTVYQDAADMVELFNKNKLSILHFFDAVLDKC